MTTNDDERDDERDSADAFGAIGNEHRVAILRALMDGYQAGATPLSYSELLDRVDVRDSGKFNYHLQQLVGRFVAGTDDGYALTYAGRTVVSAIASGTPHESADLDPRPVEGSCYACGATSLVLRYPGERVRVTCEACAEEVVHIQFPPAAVAARSVPELARDFDRWVRSWHALAGDGICPECSGRIVGELGRETVTPADGNVDVRAVVACEQCWVRGGIPPGSLVVEHPEVVSFLRRQGVDVRSRPLWQHQWALSDEHLTVRSEDPLRVEVEVPGEGTSLFVTIDRSLAVASVEERPSD